METAIIDDQVMKQDIQARPDEKIADRLLVFFSLPFQVIQWNGTGPYNETPGGIKKTFFKVREKMKDLIK